MPERDVVSATQEAALWRLTLSCGHTAVRRFLVPGEAGQAPTVARCGLCGP